MPTMAVLGFSVPKHKCVELNLIFIIVNSYRRINFKIQNHFILNWHKKYSHFIFYFFFCFQTGKCQVQKLPVLFCLVT